MTAPAAIAAQLVDMRNVGTHKSLKLTLHVPEEYALKTIEAFGWPTMVDPVPVALARLDPDQAAKPRPKVAVEKRLTQQAGICCSDPVFRRFMVEEGKAYSPDESEVTIAVRSYCGVSSRSEIIPGSPAADKWDRLWGRFQAWKLAG